MNDHSDTVATILGLIGKHSRFVLTTHINPDGDGLGSALALHLLLTSLGKESHIITTTPVSASYAFMDPEKRFFETYSGVHKETIYSADVIFVLDISVLHRLGIVGDVVQRSHGRLVCIDHHSSNNFRGDVKLIDDRAAATAVLVHELFKQGGFAITKEVAEALYLGIMTDTGCFRFSNSDADAHRIASELIDAGVNHGSMYRHMYEQNSWEKNKLFARTFGGIRKAADGRIAWMTITQEMFRETGTTQEDTEGFVEYPRNIGDVQVSILFVERSQFDIKLSFRSSSVVRVDELAGEFGGGGHKNAAAAILHGTTLDKAIETVLHTAEKYLKDG